MLARGEFREVTKGIGKLTVGFGKCAECFRTYWTVYGYKSRNKTW